jgi:hypothetical protein
VFCANLDQDVVSVPRRINRETHRSRCYGLDRFDRDQPSRHYANRINYRVRALKVTTLVDVETVYITDIHSTTSKKHDAKIDPQVARRNAGDLQCLAAGHGCGARSFRDKFLENSIRSLIKRRIMNPLDHTHTPAWMVICITSVLCQKLSSPQSSACSALPCMRVAGGCFEKCYCKRPSITFAGASDIREIKYRIPKLKSPN